ncbi:deoxynucleoside triphosphate triphosphohydrolase SAMHD1-like [Cyprinus carpio]|uniref:Deoxynucleoside triphosphate triphosphohydrolase SAMHD1-like n=1 Tax=Cyprinus carpio TaxID=7962 RepID=A0A9Q9WTF2_CYPCA|nr:deoxynucleoside triphosphate triphosphohydrolase SAMHD1-like [Cyprinus carpio]
MEINIFNDPIHGKIELHPLLVKIIDTPQFQRLRHLKQLGALSLVYPGGTHTRFEHSLGVAYLAGCLVKTLDINQPELNITPGDMLCVQIAGLCHDLGHGPLSHLFDGKFIASTRPGYQWKHEKGSIDLFRNLVEDNGLREEMENYGLNPGEDLRFIEELIMGVEASVAMWPENRARPENKSFLYEIVANKQNGVDVDKWDYLARDAYHLGIQNSFDYQCLLKSARVCEVEIGQRNVQSVRITEKVCELGGEARKQHFPLKDNRVCEIELEKKNVRRLTICFRDKVADDIYDMFYTRYTLHRQALQHKVGFVIDERMKDVLVEADGHLQISAAIDNMAKYTRLTDDIFEEIRHSSEPGLNGAKAILDKIAHRCLPKFVGEARLKESRREPENHVKDMCRDNNLNAQHFQIYDLDMGFGIVGGNLLDNVYFYNKRDLNTAFRIQSYQVSSLKPVKFHERLVRVYCTDMDQRDAEWHFREWCRINRQIIDYHEPVSNNDNPEPEVILQMKVFNDPIHGQIKLHPLLVKIIDTPQFQRLRHIKQLGGAYLVYPGATHTRFENSIGYDYLKKKKKKKKKKLRDSSSNK